MGDYFLLLVTTVEDAKTLLSYISGESLGFFGFNEHAVQHGACGQKPRLSPEAAWFHPSYGLRNPRFIVV